MEILFLKQNYQSNKEMVSSQLKNPLIFFYEWANDSAKSWKNRHRFWQVSYGTGHPEFLIIFNCKCRNCCNDLFFNNIFRNIYEIFCNRVVSLLYYMYICMYMFYWICFILLKYCNFIASNIILFGTLLLFYFA